MDLLFTGVLKEIPHLIERPSRFDAEWEGRDGGGQREGRAGKEAVILCGNSTFDFLIRNKSSTIV